MPPLATSDAAVEAKKPSNPGALPGLEGMLISRPGPRGITVLMVEDSRFASDAMRLICGRLGMRMRRAETIEAARNHLRTYLPDIVLVDLGLPDGRGEQLIRQIILSPLRPALVLGTSGAEDGRHRCLAAGVDGFLAKPVESVASFGELIHKLCPDLGFRLSSRVGGATGREAEVTPDPLALRDDLSLAAALLSDQDGVSRYDSYIGPFLAGVAGYAHDEQLATAVRNVAEAQRETQRGETFRSLEGLIRGRIKSAGLAAGIGLTKS